MYQAHITVRFTIVAISAVFPGDHMFFIDAACTNRPSSACFIVFTRDLLQYHPLLRIHSHYIITAVRSKIMTYSQGQTSRLVLMTTTDTMVYPYSACRTAPCPPISP